jgi:transketolase
MNGARANPEVTMPDAPRDVDTLCVNTIKFLAADAVERARSGHPGAPMGAADMAFVLWSRTLRFDPADPQWIGRDRFVLSAGHASMLLYALLHLFEFDLPMEEIKRFRQWGSKTPGHPECVDTPGVEVTTGPLGQGFGNAVGMALAQRMMRARFPEAGSLLDHRVFVLASDGDLMEGVASEAASLAGHWGLGNLVVLYDDNGISIEGPTALAFSEDVPRRFEAYGWSVQRIDGHDHAEIASALDAATEERGRPSFIDARTIIARGAPTKAGSAKAHGEPLGGEELRRAKEAAGWPAEPAFHVPEDARRRFHARAVEQRALRTRWDALLHEFHRDHPDVAARWEEHWRRAVPEDLGGRILAAVPEEPLATRAHSGRAIQAAAHAIPWLVGGSADLDPSTLTAIRDAGDVAPRPLERGAPIAFDGRTLHFGVREHAMGAIVNGMARYGAFLPYAATFLIFSDYMRPAIRLAALMRCRVIFVFTHDSVFLGEDGPTHQPIEQLASLRLIPNLRVWRPADAVETAVAWSAAIGRESGPTALVLTRQKLPLVARAPGFDWRSIGQGGYVLAGGRGSPDVTLIATGSEVALIEGARASLEGAGLHVRTVSMPCVEAFLEQPASYRDEVLPMRGRRVVVEAGRMDGWAELAGAGGLRIGISQFGASAPAETIGRELGFTPERVAARVREWLDVELRDRAGV